MRKRIALLAAVMMVCGLLLGKAEVQAADTGKLKILSGGSGIVSGQEVSLQFSLDGYDGIRKGIYALKGRIVYDPEIFTGVEPADFETVSGWENLQYNPDNGQFTVMKKIGSTGAEEVFRLNLTAGEFLPDQETEVAVTDLSVSEGTEDLFPSGASVTFMSGSGNISSEEGETPGAEPTPGAGGEAPESGEEAEGAAEPGSGTEAGTGQAAQAEETGKEQTEQSGNAETGDAGQKIFAVAAVVAAALLTAGAIALIHRKKFPSGRKLLAVILAGGTAAVLFSAVVVRASAGTGDLNGDGTVDDEDILALKRHLISLERLPAEKEGEADLNGDGGLTVTDLALLIRGIYSPDGAAAEETLTFQDITEITLYYMDESGSREVPMLDITGGMPEDEENYYALIEMDRLPDFYGGIREFRRDRDTGAVEAVLSQEGLVRYGEEGSGEEEFSFPVAYTDEEGDHPLIRSAEELFQKMAADPDGSYELTEDLDASAFPADRAAVPGTFSGELDGNGFRILNLRTSLFETLSGASVRNLVIEDADVTGNRRGLLADYIRNQSEIRRVFLVDSSISNGMDGMGAFAGELTGSVIRESASVDVSVRGLVAVGGIVGKTGSGAEIADCSVTGKIEGTYNHPSLGARAGGITGWHGGGVIRRCVTEAQILSPDKKGCGGLIGGPDKGSPRIEHSLSLSGGTAYRIAGFGVLQNVEEVYEYGGSDSATNVAEDSGVKTAGDPFRREFFEDTLGFDEKVWDLEVPDHGRRPGLLDAPADGNVFKIPDYSEVCGQEDYRMDRERAYANMAKLSPFAGTARWVQWGNQLSETDLLAAEMIRAVIPLDRDGAFAAGILKTGPEEVKKIRILFESGQMQEYDVSFRTLVGNLIAAYRIHGLEQEYQFPRYASDPGEELPAQITEQAEAFDYDADLASLTPEDESRLYRDYYNETIRPEMEKLVRKILTSQEDYPTYSEAPVIREYTQLQLQDGEKIRKLLYAYNYYDKWYRIDYSGVSLSDLMFFGGELLAEGMDTSFLTEKLFLAAESMRETNQTVTFYNSVLKSLTGQDLMGFLGNLAADLGGISDPNEWFAGNFAGVLVEHPSYGDSGAIRYRIWDNLCGLEDRRRSIVLPILTAPQEDMYLISVPSQILIGSMNRYSDYLEKDGQERERMRRTAEIYAEKMGIFYGVSSQWMSSSAEQLNSFVNIQYDTRLNFPESAAASAGEQKKDVTRDPVMKWVYEANHMISALNGSAAVANGSDVIWMWDPALGTSDYTFFTFSHETAHNQDGRYFYGGAGRRKGTGGEAHADGNIAQEMRDGCMVFNISKINDIGTEMTGNFSYERIDSADKVHSYYREMFETGYVLDYLAARAFLSLAPKEQAAVAVQAEHVPAGNNSMQTIYRKLTEKEFAAMDLRDLDDLWEHRISIRTSRTYPETVATATDGSYGFESFYTMNWYQSHNDSGSPDTHSFKRLGQEMLGLAGYENGYMVYMSALSGSDLEALQTITGNPDITWKEYKLNRYEQVKQKLDQIPYFSPETVIEQFRQAFLEDAASGNGTAGIETKRMLYGMIKRVTGDFSEGGIYRSPEVTPVTSAEQLIRLAEENPFGYYRLEKDLDFTGIEAVSGSYIPERFIGILDGNGCRLTGMRYPLFGDIRHSLVKDLIIQDPSYSSEAKAVLAVKGKKLTVGNVRAEGADTPLPLVKDRTEGYYEYGDTSVNVGENRIRTPEEFLAIGESAESLKKKYILETSLDFTSVSTGDWAVAGNFSGELHGNGFSVAGLEGPLFQAAEGAVIRDLTIDASHLTRDTQKGALANEIRSSEIENVRVRDLKLQNNASQVGALAGQIRNSMVRRISVENASIRAVDTIGGLAGQFDGRLLEDCMVTGTVEGTSRHSMGARVGGLTGWLGDGIVRNCLAKAEITAPERVGNGGLIGGPDSGIVALESCVSLGTGVNANRVSGWDVLGITCSVYELETSDSQTGIHPGTEKLIYPLPEEKLREKSFYTDTLGWKEEIWNFDTAAADGLPQLR